MGRGALKSLPCVGVGGATQVFWLERQDEPDQVCYRVHLCNPPVASDEFYEAVFTLETERARQQRMNAPQVYYRGKGIPEAVIRHAAADLDVVVCSCSNRAGQDEVRTDAATKVWDRLVKAGDARYDRGRDRYHLFRGA